MNFAFAFVVDIISYLGKYLQHVPMLDNKVHQAP